MIYKYVTCTSKKTDTSIFILYLNVFRMQYVICDMQVDCQFVEIAISFSFHKTDFRLNDSLKNCIYLLSNMPSWYLFTASVESELINHMAPINRPQMMENSAMQWKPVECWHCTLFSCTCMWLVDDEVYNFIDSHLNYINIHWIIFEIRWTEIRPTIQQNNILHSMEIVWIIVWHSIWKLHCVLQNFGILYWNLAWPMDK